MDACDQLLEVRVEVVEEGGPLGLRERGAPKLQAAQAGLVRLEGHWDDCDARIGSDAYLLEALGRNAGC